MLLSTLVAVLALQAPKPAPAPAAKPAASEADRFIADFDQAVAVAKKEHKDLLVDFTGSDWCSWCIKLHKEVFEFDSFLDAAEESFVLVALDYPHSDAAKSKVPNAARNAELSAKYRIGGFPTVLLMTADGDVFAKTGYQKGGPDKYLEHVKGLVPAGKKELGELNEFAGKTAAAKGAEKLKLIDEAIAQLTGIREDSPFGPKIASIVRQAFTADPDNAQGAKLKATEALLKAGEVDDATATAVMALDAKNASGLYERLVAARFGTIGSKEQIAPALKTLDDLLAAGPFKDMAVGKQLLASATFMSKEHLKDVEKAKLYATKLKALGLDGEDDKGLKQLVDDVLKGAG